MSKQPYKSSNSDYEPSVASSGSPRQPNFDNIDERSQDTSKTTRPKTLKLVVDPQVRRYLEGDTNLGILDREVVLHGYECFLVEQWACSRARPGFVIVTHTGDESKTAVVSVLAIPEDEALWSPRTKEYFATVSSFHAQKRETPLGLLMVTNLSNFPSALTVIPVPEGDVAAKWPDFVVNENLKKLECAGRSGLTLNPPNNASQAKFQQLYKTNEHIHVSIAAVELVKLCQLALIGFGVLSQQYADGLLCDYTERAISEWWQSIGIEQFGIEPVDGILGPTTVAALLGTFIGVRDRLSTFGAPAPKDPFDMSAMQRAITYFQKFSDLQIKGHLDNATMEKLHQSTEKDTHDERKGFSRTVKSTVADISGKGGEMMMNIVGGKEKTYLGEVETTDLDTFISLITGERPRLLWHGRGKRSGTGGLLEGSSLAKFLEDGGYTSRGNEAKSGSGHFRRNRNDRRTDELPEAEDDNDRIAHLGPGSWSTDGSLSQKDTLLEGGSGWGMLRHVASKVTDARDRVKDAVGRSNSKAIALGREVNQSRGDVSERPYLSPSITNEPTPNATASTNTSASSKDRAVNEMVDSRHASTKTSHEKLPLSIDTKGSQEVTPKAGSSITSALKLKHYTDSPFSSEINLNLPWLKRDIQQADRKPGSHLKLQAESVNSSERAQSRVASEGSRSSSPENIQPLILRDPAVIRLFKQDGSQKGAPTQKASQGHNILLRTHTQAHVPVTSPPHTTAVSALPNGTASSDLSFPVIKRHSSFEDLQRSSNLTESPNALIDENPYNHDHLAFEKDLQDIHALQYSLTHPLTRKIALLQSTDADLKAQLERIRAQHLERADSRNHLQEGSEHLLTQERESLLEATRNVEVLVAKLEYEFDALKGKCADVEEAVGVFERGVVELERRAEDLMSGRELERGRKRGEPEVQGWWRWGRAKALSIVFGPIQGD